MISIPMAGSKRINIPGGSPGRLSCRRTLRLVPVLAVLFFCITGVAMSWAQSSAPVRAAVFNFSARNLEASAYGTTVTNALLNNLKNRPGFSVLDRKELESFLTLNDLQQNDHMDNVILVGSRLGLNIVVTGSVERKGTMLTLYCKVVHIEQRKPVLDVRLAAFGDAGLARELDVLADRIAGAVTSSKQTREETPTAKAPVNVQKKSGNMKIYLSWESPPGATGISGWEVFRGSSATGPFARIAQVNRPEYWDQTVERNRTYQYKIRSFSSSGGYSDFSAVVAAESAPTPNPPVILRTDSRVRGIQLTWLPSPTTGDDPLKFKGYKLYRAKGEDGPYREVKDVTGLGPGQGTDVSGSGKVIFVDSGIGDDERYFYRVTACNEKDLESDFSRALAGSSLPRVSDVRATGEQIREVPLSWKPIVSPFVRGYHIYRSESPSGNFARLQNVIPGPAGADGRVSCVDREGLGDRKTYYYRVTVFEEGGAETSPSDTASAITRDKPPVPQGLKAEGSRVKKILLTWQACTREDVQGYRLYRSQKKEGPFEPIGKLSGRSSFQFEDAGGVYGEVTALAERALGLGGLPGTLGDGSVYFYRMTSYNQRDVESEPSPTVLAQTKPRPKAPAGLRGEVANGKAILRWDANSEPDIVRYDLYERGLFGLEKIAAVSGTSHAAGEMAKGKSRVFSVRAVDRDALESESSPEITVNAP